MKKELFYLFHVTLSSMCALTCLKIGPIQKGKAPNCPSSTVDLNERYRNIMTRYEWELALLTWD